MAVFHLKCWKEKYPDSKANGWPSRPGYKAHCAHCGTVIAVGELMTYPRRGRFHAKPNANAVEPEPLPAEEPEAADEPEEPEPTPYVNVDPKPVNNGIAELLLAAIMPAIDAKLAAFKPDVDLKSTLADIMAKVDAKLASVGALRIEFVQPSGAVVDVGVQHKTFPTLLKALQTRNKRPIWLSGPSGSGKTTAAEAAAKALGVRFAYTGAVGDQYGLSGYMNSDGDYVPSLLRDVWENGGLFLWDEVDASDPNALLWANALLANGVAAFPDKVVPRHPNCYFVAAANTWGHGATHEYVGRTKIDGAFLKRFIFIAWNYDEELERNTCGNPDWARRVQDIRRKVTERGIKVLITPRESYYGAELLEVGFEQSEVENMTVRAGMTDSQWAQVA